MNRGQKYTHQPRESALKEIAIANHNITAVASGYTCQHHSIQAEVDDEEVDEDSDEVRWLHSHA